MQYNILIIVPISTAPVTWPAKMADLHVVMVPWLAFGHMIPFLQLSIALAKAGVRVSFVSTPRNIRRLPKLPPDLEPLISFKIQYLKLAYDLLQHPFKKFVADQSPDWIISDTMAHWVVETAEEHRIPSMAFILFSSAAAVFWVSFPSSVAFRGYEARTCYAGFFGENVSGITDAHRVAKVCHACKAVAVRSCIEFEGEYLNIHEKIMGKPVIPVGFLPPEKQGGRETTEGSWSEIFKWLDEQKPKSVVFVGFGSECKLTKDQVHEIAYGLELSELPFLWALRKPNWTMEDIDALPSCFSDRTSGKGIVWMGWAPQMEILAHPSIGGSLFHSGWGSVIETLQFGHCLVLLPFIVDQGLNARLLVEKGLAVEIERSEDGSFSREDIAKSLRVAMVSEEGEKLRARAREAAAIFIDKRLQQEHYIGGLVKYLKAEVSEK
ncbi:unnamed protein product, partial [Vitis vinifera]